jgi:hypothetical protein
MASGKTAYSKDAFTSMSKLRPEGGGGSFTPSPLPKLTGPQGAIGVAQEDNNMQLGNSRDI